MSDRTLSIWVGVSIIYLYGTVNGEAATFTLVCDGYWQATVTRSDDDNYLLHLEAYSADGLAGTYDYTLYYGMVPSVIDRTPVDVQNKTDKGYYNVSDLNRVNHNVEYLSGLLNWYGYAVTISDKTDWTQSGIPTATQAEKYLANVAALKAKFYGTEPLPSTMAYLGYINANNIEKLLNEVESYITRMVAGFRKCGTQKCGTEVIL